MKIKNIPLFQFKKSEIILDYVEITDFDFEFESDCFSLEIEQNIFNLLETEDPRNCLDIRIDFFEEHIEYSSQYGRDDLVNLSADLEEVTIFIREILKQKELIKELLALPDDVIYFDNEDKKRAKIIIDRVLSQIKENTNIKPTMEEQKKANKKRMKTLFE